MTKNTKSTIGAHEKDDQTEVLALTRDKGSTNQAHEDKEEVEPLSLRDSQRTDAPHSLSSRRWKLVGLD